MAGGPAVGGMSTLYMVPNTNAPYIPASAPTTACPHGILQQMGFGMLPMGQHMVPGIPLQQFGAIGQIMQAEVQLRAGGCGGNFQMLGQLVQTRFDTTQALLEALAPQQHGASVASGTALVAAGPAGPAAAAEDEEAEADTIWFDLKRKHPPVQIRTKGINRWATAAELAVGSDFELDATVARQGQLMTACQQWTFCRMAEFEHLCRHDLTKTKISKTKYAGMT